MTAPKFVVVLCVAAAGTFRRCGLTFTRTWRPLEVGETADLSATVPVITSAMLAAIDKVSKPQNPHTSGRKELEGPPMLSWRPASSDEVSTMLEAQPVGDSPVIVADMKAKLADLEARVMRNELGGGRAASNDDTLAKENAELKERLARLEALVAATTAPKAETGKTDEKPVAKDAAKK